MSGDNILLGKIVGVHGVRGLVSIQSYTQIPEDITTYKPLYTHGGAEIDLTFKFIKKNQVVCAVAGVDNREGAQALKNTSLYIEPQQLEEIGGEDTFYIRDLIGLKVSVEGAQVGTVQDVKSSTGGDILAIHLHGDATSANTPTVMMVPFRKEFVGDVDLESKTLPLHAPSFESLKQLL